MNLFLIIIYVVAPLACLYVAGIVSVWLCEMKRNVLYREMQNQFKSIENFRVSMAVLHVKMYKINRDYCRKMDEVERLQQFILKNILFVKKSSLKNMPVHQNG